MPKAEPIIPGLADRDSRINEAIAAFRTLQSQYEACLHTENPLEPPVARTIAASYYILPSTFSRRLREVTKPIKLAHIQEQRITKEEEESLATWIGLMQIWGWLPRICQVRLMATEFLIRRGVNVIKRPLGVNWIQKFLQRHPHLDSNWSQSIEHDRLRFNCYENIQDWFLFFQQVVERYNLLLSDVYNMDEKGFAQGLLGTLKVVCDRRLKGIDKPLHKHCGSREWVSIIECICADGTAISSHLIFAGKEHPHIWLDTLIACGLRDGSTSATESGWTNNEIGVEWLQQSFEPQTRHRRQGQYRCLLLDGHGSHLTTAAIQFCINNGIIMICLPSHSTHLLQPLDVGIFGPMATYYKGELEAMLHGKFGFVIDKLKFIQVFCKARAKTMSEKNILSSWKAAGLFPYCPEVVLQKVNRRNRRPSTPKEGSVTITAFNGASVTMAMSPDKAELINDCVSRYEEDPSSREVMLTCMTMAAQAVADAHVYKRTNVTLIEAARLEEESKSRRKGQNSKARVLNEWIRSQEHMKALMEEEIKALSSIHLDIFRYSTASQLIIDRINQQAAKEAEQVAKELAKTAAKQLTILKRQATKDENDLCKALRSMADAGIFELQAFDLARKRALERALKSLLSIY